MSPGLIKAIILIVLVGGIIGLFYAYGEKQFKRGELYAAAQIAATTEKENEKIRKTKAAIKHSTQGLDRAGVVNELCRFGWVRNPDKCPD